MRKTVMATLLAASMLSAGGKYIAPVAAPVVPIETMDPTPWYIGGGLAWAKLSEDSCFNEPGCSYEDATWGMMVRGGYEVNQYFGIEARWLRTFWDEGPFGGTPLQHVGIFAKPQVPVSERANVYGLLGYGYTENLGSGGRLNYFDSDDGFSAGIGFEYDLSDRDSDYDALKTENNPNPQLDREFDGHGDQEHGWSLFVDYQRLLIKSNIPDLDAVSFGVRYDF
jgi:OOP family OmpA-OmpF porin